MPELVAKLKAGKGYDLFRLSLYEAAALGANMSVPYGAWMGSVEEDSFWAPHELCTEIQEFLAENEALFGRETASEIAVIYSIGSHFERGAHADELANNPVNRLASESIPFWDVCTTLADAGQPFDVRFFPDGDLRPDTMTAADLHQYRTVILPDCITLTVAQADLLLQYLDGGGAVLALGEFGLNLQSAVRNALAGHAGCTVVDLNATVRPDDFLDGPQIRWTTPTPPDIAVNVQRIANGVALHLVRYDYDADTDRVPPLPELQFDVRLPETFALATAISPEKR